MLRDTSKHASTVAILGWKWDGLTVSGHTLPCFGDGTTGRPDRQTDKTLEIELEYPAGCR
jgi:hypothetical protein